MSAGLDNSAAITSRGDLYTWGFSGTDCKLGHGDDDSEWEPRLLQVKGPAGLPPKFVSVSLGARCVGGGTLPPPPYCYGGFGFLRRCCCHPRAQTVWCPRAPEGALCNLSPRPLSLSLPPPPPPCPRHTLAIDAEGRLYAWGRVSFGRLGFDTLDGDPVSVVPVPTVVPSMAKVWGGGLRVDVWVLWGRPPPPNPDLDRAVEVVEGGCDGVGGSPLCRLWVV